MKIYVPSLLARTRLLVAACFVLASATFATAATPVFWKTRGNGFILEQRGDRFRMFESTRLSLLPIGSGVIRGGQLLYQDTPVLPAAEFFAMSDRICGLPAAALTSHTADPEKLFELFWTTIDENYAFFDLVPRHTWKNLHTKFRPRVTRRTTQNELWTIFSEMIRPLNDGHMRLIDAATGRPHALSRGPSPSSWLLDPANDAVPTVVSYLDSFTPDENLIGPALFGTLGGGEVGYLNIFAYDGFGAGGITPAVHGDPVLSALTTLSSYSDEVVPFAAMLDHVLTRFADTRALIIDLRFNQGGSGDLPVELANRLTACARRAYSYRVRNGGPRQFEPPVTVRLTPKTPAFLGRPVIVLTSNNTASAGDLQALILRELPNVAVIGEPTYGIFSEGIPRQIPVRVAGTDQGWVLTVSTQRLYSARGEFFEQRGVPPDVEVPPDRDALAQGTDNVLDAALEFLAAEAASR